jgi:hypothetical protein
MIEESIELTFRAEEMSGFCRFAKREIGNRTEARQKDEWDCRLVQPFSNNTASIEPESKSSTREEIKMQIFPKKPTKQRVLSNQTTLNTHQ